MNIFNHLQESLKIAKSQDNMSPAQFVKRLGPGFLRDPKHYSRAGTKTNPSYWGSLLHTLDKLTMALEADMYTKPSALIQGSQLMLESLSETIKNKP
jgi:hypothetical protein